MDTTMWNQNLTTLLSKSGPLLQRLAGLNPGALDAKEKGVQIIAELKAAIATFETQVGFVGD